MKHYDATKEFAKFDRSKETGRHPNKGLTTPHPVSGKHGKSRK